MIIYFEQIGECIYLFSFFKAAKFSLFKINFLGHFEQAKG